MYSKGDILLFALSAWGNVSWQKYRQCFDEIQRMSTAPDELSDSLNASLRRWDALRVLNCLGHADYHFGANEARVAISPPAVVALPGFQSYRAILCGARAPSTVEDARTAAAGAGAEINVTPQDELNPYAPARVEFRSGESAKIHAVADGMGLPYIENPPGRMLARVSASLQEYLQGLSWSDTHEINWRRKDFDTGKLRFITPDASASSTRLSRYQNPTTSLPRHWLWKDGMWAEVDLDWGRYAILALTSRQALRYDEEQRKAFVPLGAPLPILLARALALCSGYCPTQSAVDRYGAAGRYHAFRDVPPSVFNTIAGKVNQQS